MSRSLLDIMIDKHFTQCILLNSELLVMEKNPEKKSWKIMEFFVNSKIRTLFYLHIFITVLHSMHKLRQSSISKSTNLRLFICNRVTVSFLWNTSTQIREEYPRGLPYFLMGKQMMVFIVVNLVVNLYTMW